MKRILFALMIAAVFTACQKEKRDCPSSTEKTFANTGFTKLAIGETLNVNVKQGNAYSIKASGCSQELNELVLTEQSGTLNIGYNRYRGDRYRE